METRELPLDSIMDASGREKNATSSRRFRHQEYTDSKLYTAFWPFFLSLKIVGLHFTKDYIINKKGDKGNLSLPWRQKYTLSAIYCTCVFVGMTLNTLRLIPSAVLAEGMDGIEATMHCGWAVLCVFNTFSCYVGCLYYSNIPEFFMEWKKQCSRSEKCLQISKRKALLCTFACWAATLSNTVFSAYLLFATDEFEQHYYPFKTKSKGQTALKLLTCVAQFYFSAAWTFPIGLTYLVCDALNNEFKVLTDKIKDGVSSRSLEFVESIKTYRQSHVNVVSMVRQANDFLTYHLAASCLLNTVLILVNLFRTLWEADASRPFDLVIHVFWVFTVCVTFAVDLLSAQSVNNAAHEALDYVHQIDTDLCRPDSKPDIQHQISLFAGRLGGSAIGLTPMNAFVIDRPCIITLLGLLISYFIIMIQFRQADSAAGCTPTEVLLLCANMTKS